VNKDEKCMNNEVLPLEYLLETLIASLFIDISEVISKTKYEGKADYTVHKVTISHSA
jgi:hypothetical protein